MPDVKRLQIMIDEDLDAILERMARDEGTSKAALIRRFVRERVSPLPPIRDDAVWEMSGIAGDIEIVPGETIDDVVYPR
jgi:hypothetical protein